MACKLYIRIKIRGAAVQEQIQWILEYKIVEKFLADIKKEFGGGDKEGVKVAELKKLEQEGKMMEEFV